MGNDGFRNARGTCGATTRRSRTPAHGIAAQKRPASRVGGRGRATARRSGVGNVGRTRYEHARAALAANSEIRRSGRTVRRESLLATTLGRRAGAGCDRTGGRDGGGGDHGDVAGLGQVALRRLLLGVVGLVGGVGAASGLLRLLDVDLLPAGVERRPVVGQSRGEIELLGARGIRVPTGELPIPVRGVIGAASGAATAVP